MDKLIEEGQFKEAASISDKLAQREFATKVSKAFDCLEYSKRKKVKVYTHQTDACTQCIQ